MKFVKKNYFFYTENIFTNEFKKTKIKLKNYFLYDKLTIINKKYLNEIRPGLTNNKKKNSIKRDKNISLLGQFININQKKGNKKSFHKNMNIMVNNIFSCLNESNHEFENYNNYNNLVYLYNNDPFYSDFNKIVENYLKSLESIFEIKTIKNNKKLKLPNKYTHEIVYLPKERRLKYVLKSLSIYKENFKKYELWDRLFWSFFLTLVNKEKSAISKRKLFIYMKSIKFFKKKIKK